MATFLFLLSAICFIAAYGIHMYAVVNSKENPLVWCEYMDNTILSAIPWICGFILAVIPECFIFSIKWYWMFLINLVVVYIAGPICANLFLKRFASGKGAGVDILIAIIVGIITCIIALITK